MYLYIPEIGAFEIHPPVFKKDVFTLYQIQMVDTVLTPRVFVISSFTDSKLKIFYEPREYLKTGLYFFHF